MSSLSPIVLFVFARPNHTLWTLRALAENYLADQSDLIVYADAARKEEEIEQVNAVREIVSLAKGFRSITVIEREKNYGLANNIIQGVTETCSRFGKLIVLEDDMLTSPHFLTYMNVALERYAEDDRVISIHGYTYPVAEKLPEAFFLRGADCWGWATWSRGWSLFNFDGQSLLDELTRRKLIREFDFNGAYPYSKMLEGQIKGVNDSWAVRWYASAFLAGKLTLYPGRSLVHNIGNDSSGTHCGNSVLYDATLSSTPIDLKQVRVGPSRGARAAFEAFLRRSRRGLASKMLRRVQQIFTRASG